MINNMNRKRTKNLNIRLTAVEMLKLKLQAEVKGTTVSKLVRNSII